MSVLKDQLAAALGISFENYEISALKSRLKF